MSSAAAIVLANIPSPDRGVWQLGPIPIRAYALCIIAGIIVAVVWGERRLQARGGPAGAVVDVAVWAVPFGLVGGRLYHVATDWETYFGPGGNPVDALKIWQGGLGIWGAIALGGVGAWIGCRRRGIPLPFFADAVAPGIVVAQAIGRLGNYFNQELYGGHTDLPWGLEIYQRVVPGTSTPDAIGGVAVDNVPIDVVHPTFLYELLWCLGVAVLVVWADRRFKLGHGRAFAVYVAGYTAGRFWIEIMRTDPATRVFGDIRINVVVAAGVFLLAVAYLLLVRKPREVLSFADPDGAGPDQAEPAARAELQPAAAAPLPVAAPDPAGPAAVAAAMSPAATPGPVEQAVPAEVAVTAEPEPVAAAEPEPAAKAEPAAEPEPEPAAPAEPEAAEVTAAEPAEPGPEPAAEAAEVPAAGPEPEAAAGPAEPEPEPAAEAAEVPAAGPEPEAAAGPAEPEPEPAAEPAEVPAAGPEPEAAEVAGAEPAEPEPEPAAEAAEPEVEPKSTTEATEAADDAEPEPGAEPESQAQAGAESGPESGPAANGEAKPREPAAGQPPPSG